MHDLWCQLVHDLHALLLSYQVAHWQSKGPNSYSDHLLFQRLYEATQDEIDPVVEKMVGLLGADARFDPGTIARGTMSSLSSLSGPTAQGDFAAAMLEAERMFLAHLDNMVESLRGMGKLMQGVENLLQGIGDTHETHVYLLGQRTSTCSATEGLAQLDIKQ